MTNPNDRGGAGKGSMDGMATRERIADILMVLSEVTAGDLSSRLTLDLPEGDPFLPLYKGINETIAALQGANQQSEAYQRELEDKLATIDRQRLAIRELSTPVIEVWEGLLCLPVVGVMDTVRSAEMTETLLVAVAERKARCAIIDITGIEIMDTGSADHFIRMARAVRYLGARCVLTGISPVIAQTIVHLGVNMEGIITRRSLRDALQEYVAAQRARARPRPAAAPAAAPEVEEEPMPTLTPKRSIQNGTSGAVG